MARRFKRGETLREIGKRHNISHEGVRLIMQKRGLTRKDYPIHEIRHKEALAKKNLIIEAYKKKSGTADQRTIEVEIGRELGLSTRAVNEVIKDYPFKSLYDHKSRITPKFSDEDLIKAVRLIAQRLGEPLTKDQYATEVEGTDLPVPQTLIIRFGSWHDACEAAGVTSGKSFRRYTKRFDEEACLKAAKDFWDSREGPFSFVAYSEWAKGKDVPSGGTMRVRMGKWSEVKRRIAEMEDE